MSNQHYERAVSLLHNGTNYEVARAQAEATLALAYEQRTANLIAALQHVRILGNKEWLPTEETVIRTMAEISERLHGKPKP